MAWLLAACAGAYLAGSLNWAIVVLRLLGRGDPRMRSSGNAGTSNVYRIAGPAWAAVVLLLDVGRAAGVAALALFLLPAAHAPFVGFALLLGNHFPLFHGFRGGKGVAAWLGFTAAVHPAAAALSCAAWVLVYALSRISFVGSSAMLTVLAAGILARCGLGPASVAGTVLSLALIVAAHRRNFAGTSGS
jgi:acyl phosphate:glycerol-3-phosphate acyltransferase